MPRLPKYDPEKLSDALASKLLSGDPHIRNDAKLRAISEDDRRMLQRVTGETVEVFNRRITEKLRVIEDMAAERAIEALERDEFKPSELGFILSVAHDKRTHIDGSSSLAASVGTQVNNFYLSSKEELIASLDGRKPPASGSKPAPQTVQPETVEANGESLRNPQVPIEVEVKSVPAQPNITQIVDSRP